MSEDTISNADKFGGILMLVGIGLGIYESLYDSPKLAVFMATAFFRGAGYGLCLGLGGCIFGNIFGNFGMFILGCICMSIPIWYYVNA